MPDKQMYLHLENANTSLSDFCFDCLLSMVKHGERSVMLWGTMSHCFLGPLVVLHKQVTILVYDSILDNYHHQPMVQNLFLNPMYQDNNALIHTAGVVKLQHIDWLDKLQHIVCAHPLNF